MAKALKFIDKTSSLLWMLIAVLLLSGGFKSRQVELSQINVFGFLILMFSLARFFLTKKKKFHSANEEKTFLKVESFLQKNVHKILLKFSGFVFLCILTVQWFRYYSLETNAFDLGYLSQSLWSLPQARLPLLYSSLSRGSSYFGEHFSPILLVFYPLYKVLNSIGWAFLVQSACITSGIILTYLYSKKIGLKGAYACMLGICFFLYAPTRGGAFFDFREDLFFIPLIFSVFLAIEYKNWGLYFFLLLLTFTIKENAAVLGILFGMYLLIQEKQRFFGLLSIIISLVLFFTLVKYVLPVFSGGEKQTMLSVRLMGFGIAGIEEFKALLLTNPVEILAKFWKHKISLGTLKYFLEIFSPFFVFLFLKSKKIKLLFLMALLLFLMNIVIGAQVLGYHYEAILVPFCFILAAQGFLSFQIEGEASRRSRALLFLILILCFFGRSPMLLVQKMWPKPEKINAVRVLESIPAQFSVAVQPALFPQVSFRKSCRLFDKESFGKTDFVAVSFDESVSQYAVMYSKNDVEQLKNLDYQTAYQSKLLWILCKKEACKAWKSLSY